MPTIPHKMETVLITGANSGLGFETALRCVKKGFAVILVCRTLAKSEDAKDRILKQYPAAELMTAEAEMSSLKSVRECLQATDTPVDYLICNAGIAANEQAQTSTEGYEKIFAVNHLAHFVLATELYKKFEDSLRTITVVSSSVHNPNRTKGQFPPPKFDSVRELAFPSDQLTKWKEEAGRRYVHSKLSNLLFVYGMAKRISGLSDLRINAFNPGWMVETNLARHASGFTRFMMKYIFPLMTSFIGAMRTVEESASDLLYVSTESTVTGQYFDGRKIATSSALSRDESLIDELWELSVELSQSDL